MKVIVAALDFSEVSDSVLQVAEQLAGALGAKLILVHVLEMILPYAAYGYLPAELPAIETSQRGACQRAEQILAGYRKKVAGAGLPDVQCWLLEGRPVEALAAYCQRSAVDVVVLGSHGHGALASVLLGSVADGMVRRSKVPVLIVPFSSRSQRSSARSSPQMKRAFGMEK